MYGFHGRLLHIDLSTGRSSWADLEEARLRAFLGGIGLGTSLLYEFAPPGVDPFLRCQSIDLHQRAAGRHRADHDREICRGHQVSPHRIYRRFAFFQSLRSRTQAASVSTRSSSPVKPPSMAYIFIHNEKVEIRSSRTPARQEPRARLNPRFAPSSAHADGARCRHRQSRRKLSTLRHHQQRRAPRRPRRGRCGHGIEESESHRFVRRSCHHGGRSDGRRRDRRRVARAQLELAHRQISQDRHRRQSGSFQSTRDFADAQFSAIDLRSSRQP